MDKLLNQSLWKRGEAPRRLGEYSKNLEELQRNYREKIALVQNKKHNFMKNQVNLQHSGNKKKKDEVKQGLLNVIQEEMNNVQKAYDLGLFTIYVIEQFGFKKLLADDIIDKATMQFKRNFI